MDTDSEDPNLPAAAPATNLSQLPAEYRRRFACAVEHTITQVFGGNKDDARARVRAFFDPPEGGQALLTFHLSPLQIAAGLSRNEGRQLTDQQMATYLAIQQAELGSLALFDESDSGNKNADPRGGPAGMSFISE